MIYTVEMVLCTKKKGYFEKQLIITQAIRFSIMFHWLNFQNYPPADFSRKICSQTNYRGSRPEVFGKKDALRNLAKFIGKNLCQNLSTKLFSYVYRKHLCFPVNFAKFVKAAFFIEHLRWQLLKLRVPNFLVTFNRKYLLLLNIYYFKISWTLYIKRVSDFERCFICQFACGKKTPWLILLKKNTL